MEKRGCGQCHRARGAADASTPQPAVGKLPLRTLTGDADRRSYSENTSRVPLPRPHEPLFCHLGKGEVQTPPLHGAVVTDTRQEGQWVCLLKGRVLHGVEGADKIQNPGLNLSFREARDRCLVETDPKQYLGRTKKLFVVYMNLRLN